MSRHFGRRCWWWAWLLLCWLVPFAPVQAAHPAASAHPLVLGVLAYRPADQLAPVMQPLLDYLGTRLEGRRIELRVLDNDELAQAARARQLDLVLTSPSHYMVLRHQIGRVTALATVHYQVDGQVTRSFGGTLVAAADRHDLNDWSDLHDLRIAHGGTHQFGSYYVHAFEMHERGLPYPGSNRLVQYPSQDEVVLAVVRGEVDVAQVRTGVLERLVRDKRVPAQALKVLGAQRFEGFPQQISTRLYPEWPLVALPHVDDELQRQVASALLDLTPGHPAIRSTDWAGFGPAADYLSVERVARALHLPPYEAPVPVDVWQVWQQYRGFWLALGLSVLGLCGAAYVLWRRGRQLARALHDKRALLQRIETDAKRQADLLAGSASVIYALEPQTLQPTYVGRNLKDLYGVKAFDSDDWWRQAVHPQDQERVRPEFQRWCEQGCQGIWVQTYRMRHPGGHWLWIEDRVRARRDAQGNVVELIGSHTDISERIEAEMRLRLGASVVDNAREGVIIADLQGNILDVNPSFSRITGYSREQVLGRNPRLLSSGQQEPGFYREMWNLLLETGHWEGEMINRRADGVLYAQQSSINSVCDSRGLPTHYVAVITDITDKKRYEARLERLAYYDELTGLPSRVLLTDRLRQALGQLHRETGGVLSVAFLDLDGFKDINDRHGHEVGDRVLQTLAQRLQTCVREGDTVARLGGDEFVVLLLGHETLPSQDILMLRLLHAVADPLDLEGMALGVSVSIGVCICRSEGRADADQVLRQADHAMYAAKLAGKNRYHVFDSHHEDQLRSAHALRQRMAEGLQAGEFVLYYQPKVDMRTGRVLGVEALIRWRHPEQGVLPPGAFLPATHGHELERTLGRWVLGQALQQTATWWGQGLVLPVSVNIAADHLLDIGFVDDLEQLLAEYPQLPAGSLELEVLESTALADLRGASGVLRRCQQLGVRAALDDFGTGYSSLTYLKTLPAETLKIDQSFVRDMVNDPDDLAILQGVLDLARVFRRQAVAEGVETVTHGLMLLHLGCQWGQGYGIARPMPAHELPGWCQRWQPPESWQQAPAFSEARAQLLMSAVDVRQALLGLRQYVVHEREDGAALRAQVEDFAQSLSVVGPEQGGAGTVEMRALYLALQTEVQAVVDQRQAGRVAEAEHSLQRSEQLFDGLFNALLLGRTAAS